MCTGRTEVFLRDLWGLFDRGGHRANHIWSVDRVWSSEKLRAASDGNNRDAVHVR
jgi:hypothetical protein